MQCTQRGERRHVHREFAPQVGKQRAGYHIERVQRSPAHLHKSQMQGGAKPVQVAPAGPDRLFLGIAEAEKIAELEGGQLTRQFVLAEKSELPGLHADISITGYWLKCSPQPPKSLDFSEGALSLCYIGIKCHFKNVSH